MFGSVITEGVVAELSRLKLNLSHLWLLDLYSRDTKPGGEFSVLLQALERKGLVFNGSITPLGSQLIEDVFNGSFKSRDIKKKVQQVPDELLNGFEEWWEAFPSISQFKYKGKKFEGSRGFKVEKDHCKVEWKKLMLEGITPEQMINAVKVEVEMKQRESFRTGDNKMKYMSSTLPYLRQRKFESFLDVELEEEEDGRRETVI